MRISDLQTKDVINSNDGRNIGKIIDMDINQNGSINYFIIEPKKFFKRVSFSNSETNIKLSEIIKIGEDVILVDIH